MAFYSKNYDLRFLKLFELEYKTNERKYTKVAYDIICIFVVILMFMSSNKIHLVLIKIL